MRNTYFEQMRYSVGKIPTGLGVRACGVSILTLVICALSVSVSTAQEQPEIIDEIIVTAQRNDIRTKVDREVFDVNLGDDSASLNTVDVLRRVPGLIIDPTERVTIRGGEVIGYLIDGKPARNEIAQAIPASQIASIEVIANPAADLSSSSRPLVNIILKSSASFDWVGTASVKGDTNTGFRLGLNVSRGKDTSTFRGSLSFRHRPRQRNIDRRLTFDVEQDSNLLNDSFTSRATEFNGDESFYQLSTRGNWTKKLPSGTKLTAKVGLSINQLYSEDIEIQQVSAAGLSTSTTFVEDSKFIGFYPNANVSLEKKLGADKTFNASAQAYLGFTEETQDISSANPLSFNDDTEFIFAQSQFKYEMPLGREASLLTGGSFFVNNVFIEQELSGFKGPGTIQATDFEFLRTSLAGFATYQTIWSGTEFKAGLRVEKLSQNFRESELDLPGFDGKTYALPSLHLSKNLD